MSRSAVWRTWAVGLVLLASNVARADRWVFVPASGEVRTGAVSGPWRVEAQTDAGAPSPVSTAATVTVSSSSARGQLSAADNPVGTWSTTLSVNVAPGATQSEPFYYRDGIAGRASLVASSVGFNSGQWDVDVSSLSFADDGEGSTLLTSEVPPGPWHIYQAGGVGNTFSRSGAAAHRGVGGLRVHDEDASAGFGDQGALHFISAPVPGDYFLRMWLRVAPQATGGSDIFIAGFASAASTNVALAELRVLYPAGDLYLGGFDRASSYINQIGASLKPATWSLVELGITGAGTSQGARRLWLDGTEVASVTGIDWQSPTWEMNRATVGEPWASPNRDFVGELDFDDVRASTVPPASRVSLTSAGPGSELVIGSCAPVDVSLASSMGTAATAPYDVEVSVARISGEAELFDSEDCATPTSRVTLPRGAGSSRLYVSASTAGPVKLLGNHADFLAGTLTLDAVNESEATRSARARTSGLWGWSCVAMPGSTRPWLALGLGLWLRRRSAHRPS